MPRISKIRVSNIKLDDGIKIIGDKLYNLYGNNSLFLLENGGGKSSIIQLIHQVVLPNHTMQGRPMVENVAKGETVHVAVEWIPDDEYRPLFLTGFCFNNTGEKKKVNDTPYRYFNYIIEYDYEDALRIEELPFAISGNVTGYTAMREKLKKVRGIRMPDTNISYQEALEDYGILASEWSNISIINSEEGGVTDFFDNTATTQKLLEKLIIPSLMDSLYRNDEERNAILNSFMQYKDSLMELPELRKNLRDFEMITASSDKIIDACECYNNLKEELENTQLMFGRLYKTLLIDTEENKRKITEISREFEEAQETKRHLEWKIKSYQAYELLQKYLEAKGVYEKDNRIFNDTEIEINFHRRRVKDQMAARAYGDYKRWKADEMRVDADLKTARLETGERRGMLLETRSVVSRHYFYMVTKLTEEMKEAKENFKNAGSLLNNINKNIKEEDRKERDLSTNLALASDEIKRYTGEKLELKEKMLADWDEDVPKTRDKLALQSTDLEKVLKGLESDLKRLTEEIKGLEKQQDKIENSIIHNKEDLEKAETEFSIFADTEINLMDKTFGHLTIRPDNLFLAKEQIRAKLASEKKKYEKEMIALSVKENHFDQIKKIIELKGYHIHSELESVKTHLVKNDVNVTLGVEWIAKVAMDDAGKKALLKKNPLLPVSILIEKSQLNKVRKALDRYKEETSIPIFLIDKTKMEEQEDKETIFPFQSSSYVFHRFNVRLREEDWDSYLQEIEETIESLVSGKKEFDGKLNLLREYENDLNQFWKSYDINSRKDLRTKVKEIIELGNFLKEEKKRLKEELEKKRSEEEVISTSSKEKLKEKERVDSEVRDLNSFIKRYASIQETMEREKYLVEEINGIKNNITLLENQRETREKEQEEASRLFERKKGRKTELERDKNEYGYEEVESGIEATEESYEMAKEEYKSLKKEFAIETKAIEDLEGAKRNFKGLVERSIEEIERNGYSLAGMKNAHLDYDEGVLKEAERELKDLDNRLSGEREAKEDSYKKMVVAETKYKGHKEDIEEEYEEVYQYGLMPGAEYTLFISEYELSLSNIDKLETREGAAKKQLELNRMAIEETEEGRDFLMGEEYAQPLNDGEWNKVKPIMDVRKYRGQIQNKIEMLVDKRADLKEETRKLADNVKETGNSSLSQMTYEITKIIEGSSDNYEEIIATFVKILEGIQDYEQSIEFRKEELDKRLQNIIDDMYERADTFYKNIMEIPKSSQIEENGENRSLFTIYWPKKDLEEGKRELESFVNGILEEQVELKNKNVLEKDMADAFERKVNMVNIINCYADISRCHLKALKNRNDLLGKDYYLWDEVSKWSGGEKHATRISMFLSLVNHLRKKRFSQEGAWKFIVLDNPFGAASSDHVVKPMISLAKKTNTQLFCLTGLKEKGLQRDFDTVISNQYVLQRGHLFLKSTEKHKDKLAAELDSIFYVK